MNKAQQSKQDYSVQLTFAFDAHLYAERGSLQHVAQTALQLIDAKVMQRVAQMQIMTSYDLLARDRLLTQHDKLRTALVRSDFNDETSVKETLQTFNESLKFYCAFKFTYELYAN